MATSILSIEINKRGTEDSLITFLLDGLADAAHLEDLSYEIRSLDPARKIAWKIEIGSTGYADRICTVNPNGPVPVAEKIINIVRRYAGRQEGS